MNVITELQGEVLEQIIAGKRSAREIGQPLGKSGDSVRTLLNPLKSKGLVSWETTDIHGAIHFKYTGEPYEVRIAQRKKPIRVKYSATSLRKRIDLAIRKIRPEFDERYVLFSEVVFQAIRDLDPAAAYSESAKMVRAAIITDAKRYLSGDMFHATTVGVDPAYIRRVLKKLKVFDEKDYQPAIRKAA